MKNTNLLKAFDETYEYFVNLLENLTFKERIRSQLSNCKLIVESFAEGKKIAIVQAPTGSGKSMISMIMSDVFIRYENLESLDSVTPLNYLPNRSFILTSNKFLQDQQLETAQKFDIDDDIELLKGQSNYTCHVNGDVFGLRDCLDVSLKQASMLKCAEKCEYIQRRQRCMNVSTMITSYHYWLTSMNFDYESRGMESSFPIRELTIFDECHTLEDIVQDMFAFTITSFLSKTIQDTFTKVLPPFVDTDNIQIDGVFSESEEESFTITVDMAREIAKDIKVINDILDNLCKEGFTDQYIFDNFKILLEKLITTFKILKKKSNTFDKDPKKHNQQERSFIKFIKQLHSLTVSLSLCVDIFSNEGVETIIQSISEETMEVYNAVTKKPFNQKYKKVSFKCSKLGSIMQARVFKYTNYSLFMSATIGKPEVFYKDLGLKQEDVFTLDIESDFNFDKSKIILLSNDINLSFAKFDDNIFTAFRAVLRIINNHKNDNIIVHGTQKIIAQLKSSSYRHEDMVFHDTDEEKLQIIDKMKTNIQNGEKRIVFVSHAIVEGVSFDDDMARVNILIKNPYPSLADNYNKVMFNLSNEWYTNKTIQKVQQTIGRSNRHKDDYSICYLIESSFSRLFAIKESNFPKYIQQRAETRNMDYLNTPYLSLLRKKYDKELDLTIDESTTSSNDNYTYVNTIEQNVKKHETNPLILALLNDDEDDLPY